jgi:F-type H+-transporting ATPase subunit b
VEAALKIFDMTPTDLYMILVVGALFIVLWQILDKILFSPYLNLIAAREQATVGVEEEAQKTYVKAEVGIRDYESKVAEARKSAMQKKMTVIDDAKKKADEIINSAKEQAANITAEAKSKLWNEAEDSRRAVIAQADTLAGEMVAKLKSAPAALKGNTN